MAPLTTQLAERIAAGEALDTEFDALLPSAARHLSRQFWTPLGVGYQVAEWLELGGARSLLDVGSGVGKLCACVALRSARSGRTPGLCVAGIEQRASLVAIAEQVAHDLEIQVNFTTARITDTQYATPRDSRDGQAGKVQLAAADAYYLYNPFGENLTGAAPATTSAGAQHEGARPDHIDDEFQRDERAFLDSVRVTERLLQQARSGTHLITFNGFGGVVPSAYDARALQRHGLSDLIWWTKR